jgi:3-oxoadipate enol-lactonase
MPIVNVNGETIHYVKAGTGPAVALVHSLGLSVLMWRDVIAGLRDRYTLIAYDLRGHGQSSAKGECTVVNAAHDLKGVLDHVGAAQCSVVAISTGGPVALTFANKSAMHSLVLADSFAKPIEGSNERVEATAEAIAYVSMEEFGTQYAAETLLASTPLDVQDEVAAVISKTTPKAYVQLMRSALLGDFSGLLSSIRTPTLVLVGDSDPVSAMPAAEFLADNISGAKLEVLPAAGHLSCIDNPAAFTAAVGRFLDAQHQN